MLFYVGFFFHVYHLWDFHPQEEDFEAFVDCDKEAECFGNLIDAEICDSVKLNRQGMVDLEEEDEEEAGTSDESIPGVS